ncbi:hypothetical protein NQ318_001560 [Aromia moschata]|uniref:Uncharacterized protein n=1 Tax=Aromia moschata TaxID=1265417 RepID=A0AAV8XAQ9_9CUCU|nr:hypothetical protein NQ318_001560 [Aromia moschata]
MRRSGHRKCGFNRINPTMKDQGMFVGETFNASTYGLSCHLHENDPETPGFHEVSPGSGFLTLFSRLTAERSDGSTLQEGGIDLDISQPSTSFVTKVSKELIKRSWQRYIVISLYHYLDQLSKSSTTPPAKKSNMSTDSEGLTGSPKRRRKFLRTFDNYAVSLRKLTKQVGDLREENKKLKQELSLKGTIKTAI